MASTLYPTATSRLQTNTDQGPYSQRIILGLDLDFDLNSDLDFPESILKTTSNGIHERF